MGGVSPTPNIEDYAGVVFDLDGVVYRGEAALPGAAEAVAGVRAAGRGVAFVTNNAARTPDQIVDKLVGLGIPVQADEIVTSSLAAATLLEPGDRCLVIGMDGLRGALAERGCIEVTEPDDTDVVVVGFDRELVWDDLRRATVALHRGARFVGTNADATFPSPEGLWPGNGAVLAALSAATERRPEIAGKPEAPMFQAAADRLPEGRLLMIGDRPQTDIAGAHALGWDTALVLTGVTARDGTDDLDPTPTYIMDSVAELLG